jgi:hypothetical protein
MAVIPATLEAKVGRSQLETSISKVSADPICKQTKTKGWESGSSGLACLPSKYKTLSSIFNITEPNKQTKNRT